MKILVIGCGIVGAMTAYELSKAGLQVTVCEAQPTYAQGASGSALGVLMAVCSSKGEGAIAELRLASLKLFDSLLSELQKELPSELDPNTPLHRQGILCLYESNTAQAKLTKLISLRQAQGYILEWKESVAGWQCAGAMYSPSDGWVHPQRLISALVSASKRYGVKFYFNTPIAKLKAVIEEFDHVVITAGLRANQLIESSMLQPVRGLAITAELAKLHLSTVVHAVNSTGEDINIVPLGNGNYWLGATVHFAPDDCQPQRDIDWLLTTAQRFQPLFQSARVLNSWMGDRPRPKYQKAPVLGFLSQDRKILIATGHYRNGILMAPISARIIRDLIVDGYSDLPWQSFAPKPADSENQKLTL